MLLVFLGCWCIGCVKKFGMYQLNSKFAHLGPSKPARSGSNALAADAFGLGSWRVWSDPNTCIALHYYQNKRGTIIIQSFVAILWRVGLPKKHFSILCSFRAVFEKKLVCTPFKPSFCKHSLRRQILQKTRKSSMSPKHFSGVEHNKDWVTTFGWKSDQAFISCFYIFCWIFQPILGKELQFCVKIQPNIWFVTQKISSTYLWTILLFIHNPSTHTNIVRSPFRACTWW